MGRFAIIRAQGRRGDDPVSLRRAFRCAGAVGLCVLAVACSTRLYAVPIPMVLPDGHRGYAMADVVQFTHDQEEARRLIIRHFEYACGGPIKLLELKTERADSIGGVPHLAFDALAECEDLPVSNAAESSNAEQPLCPQYRYDDALRTPPESLMPEVRKLFGVSADYPRETSYYRCADGAVMVCVSGANLPCGKAVMRKSLPAASDWCNANADADFIPMSVTGRETAYKWYCSGRVAVAEEVPDKVDSRGFFKEYWKKLEPVP